MKKKEKCITVKILNARPKNQSFTAGSIKFVPLHKLDKNYMVNKEKKEIFLKIFINQGKIGQKLTVKITSRTTIECEVLDPEVEEIDSKTPILVGFVSFLNV